MLKIMIALKCGLKMKNDKSMGKKNGRVLLRFSSPIMS
jgi:hypothetical protein